MSWNFLASSGFASESPRAPAPAPPVSRWRSSPSSQNRPGGGSSTHPTTSRWSMPAPYSRTASLSNDPTDRRMVISKSRGHADPQVLTIPPSDFGRIRLPQSCAHVGRRLRAFLIVRTCGARSCSTSRCREDSGRLGKSGRSRRQVVAVQLSRAADAARLTRRSRP